MIAYVARQPIFAVDMTTYGYELLYRNSAENRYDSNVTGEEATRRLVSDLITVFGSSSILNHKPGFINFTKSLFLSELSDFLNPSDFVVEILEDIPWEENLTEPLMHLRQRGFALALDDYIGSSDSEPFLPYSDIVKVDFAQLTTYEQQAIAKPLLEQGKCLLAEKVETPEEFHHAVSCGYTLFQGYFFARPSVLQKTLPALSHTSYLRVFREINQPDPDFQKLSRIIHTDLPLTYRLLRHVNSLPFGIRHKCTSVTQAIVYLGVQEVRRWLLLVLMQDTGALSTCELSKLALSRGLFCERLCAVLNAPISGDDAYLAGMMSVLLDFYGTQAAPMLEEIFLPAGVLDPCLIVTQVLRLLRYYEAADWEKASDILSQLSLSHKIAISYYVESVNYADMTFNPEP